jgi:hypothetical protein
MTLINLPTERFRISKAGLISAESDKACLAQALLGLANHRGGHVVIGLSESAGVWQTSPGRQRRSSSESGRMSPEP